jgi:hypothetical protein
MTFELPHVEISNETQQLIAKKQKLYALRRNQKERLKELRKSIKELRELERRIVDLVQDYAKRLSLPQDKTPKEFCNFLLGSQGLNNFMAFAKGKMTLRFHEEYLFCKEITTKWAVKDVNDLIDLMQRANAPCGYTREKAIAKILVDQAKDFQLLYECLHDLDNGFELIVDSQRKPILIPKLNGQR